MKPRYVYVNPPGQSGVQCRTCRHAIPHRREANWVRCGAWPDRKDYPPIQHFWAGDYRHCRDHEVAA